VLRRLRPAPGEDGKIRDARGQVELDRGQYRSRFASMYVGGAAASHRERIDPVSPGPVARPPPRAFDEDMLHTREALGRRLRPPDLDRVLGPAGSSVGCQLSVPAVRADSRSEASARTGHCGGPPVDETVQGRAHVRRVLLDDPLRVRTARCAAFDAAHGWGASGDTEQHLSLEAGARGRTAIVPGSSDRRVRLDPPWRARVPYHAMCPFRRR
jgi:hypothetical protein